ncbi:GTP:AMP phosphotransferase, mitochondrial [Boothiomyces sp. JEL0866]|nr:GTP:AMP phosphotransferase, mitochondrial [Boothiomyces sp. JEL0866]
MDRYPQIKALSSGDALRSQILKKTAIGLKVESILASGALVEDRIVTPMVFHELDALGQKDFILDGFPRTVDQAKDLDDHLGESALNLVMNLNVPWEIILKRIEDRWIHLPSGRTYNLSWNNPKREGLDDVTGEPLVKRPDDCPKSFKLRLEQYEAQTMPLIEYYSKRGILINYTGNSSDEITPFMFDTLDKIYSVEGHF